MSVLYRQPHRISLKNAYVKSCKISSYGRKMLKFVNFYVLFLRSKHLYQTIFHHKPNYADSY